MTNKEKFKSENQSKLDYMSNCRSVSKLALMLIKVQFLGFRKGPNETMDTGQTCFSYYYWV